MPPMASMMGDSVFYHDNTLPGLTRLLRELTPDGVEAARSAVRRLAPSYTWKLAAEQTLGLYRHVMDA